MPFDEMYIMFQFFHYKIESSSKYIWTLRLSKMQNIYFFEFFILIIIQSANYYYHIQLVNLYTYLLLTKDRRMQKYHQTSPHRAQAIRIFQLIQQLNSTGYIINAQAIEKFLKSAMMPCHQDLVKFMHSIDKQDKEMRKQYWGICISRALEKNKINCELDYLNLHPTIKQLLTGTYVLPLENYQKWDGNSEKTSQQKDQMYARIVQACGELSLFIKKIDMMIFASSLPNINLCFSLITLMPEKTDQIYQIFQNIVSGTFLDNLQYTLSTNVAENTLIDMLKSLCYLYQSLKYERIRKLLQPTFLVHPDTLNGLLQNIKDKRPQVRYLTCSMIALMINNIKKLPQFLLANKQFLYQVSNAISNIGQAQGLAFGLEFLIGIIKQFQNFSQQQKKQNMKITSVYLNFAVKKLWDLKSEQTQAICIKLVSQCVKVVDFSEQDIKLLKFASNVFDGANDKKFQLLFETTLSIVKHGIMFNRKKIIQFIIGDKSFENYLKKVMSLNHEEWEPFYQAIQIVLLLSQSQNFDILFQRDLIPSIFNLVESQNGIIKFYLSQIILSLILNSLETEWKITYLYQKDCLRILGNLFNSYYTVDPVLFSEYRSQTSLSYCNRETFFNSLKALYFLNLESRGSSTLKKRQLYITNFSNFFIDSFSKGVSNFFSTTSNAKFLVNILKEDQFLTRNLSERRGPSMKTYKLISTLIEQMTMTLRKRNTSLDTLKEVNRTRNEYHRNLYQFLVYNDLVVESIPIYLTYIATISGNTIEQRIYRLTWNQFRSLMWQFVKKILMIESLSFTIIQKSTKNIIRHEDDYRKMLEKALDDYIRSNFIIDVELVDIKEKQQLRDLAPMTSSVAISMRHTGQQYRGPVQMPRFMSSRMPHARDMSPISNRHLGGSIRNVSPNFGTPCRECRKITTNRSLICNSCVQTQSFR